MKLRSIVVSALIGGILGLAPAVLGDGSGPPCPPTVSGCSQYYGKVGNPAFVCCDDLSDPTKCVNWLKQKWVCNNAPGDPVQYGYTLSSSTSSNLTCDPQNPGNCY